MVELAVVVLVGTSIKQVLREAQTQVAVAVVRDLVVAVAVVVRVL
jgi:hypothetical protein